MAVSKNSLNKARRALGPAWSLDNFWANGKIATLENTE